MASTRTTPEAADVVAVWSLLICGMALFGLGMWARAGFPAILGLLLVGLSLFFSVIL